MGNGRMIGRDVTGLYMIEFWAKFMDRFKTPLPDGKLRTEYLDLRMETDCLDEYRTWIDGAARLYGDVKQRDYFWELCSNIEEDLQIVKKERKTKKKEAFSHDYLRLIVNLEKFETSQMLLQPFTSLSKG